MNPPPTLPHWLGVGGGGGVEWTRGSPLKPEDGFYLRQLTTILAILHTPIHTTSPLASTYTHINLIIPQWEQLVRQPDEGHVLRDVLKKSDSL